MAGHLIAFDVEAPLAHFRCVYSNVASISYHFPPRNTVAGIIAAIMGFDREGASGSGYYQHFSRDLCRLAVGIIHPVRKIQLSENYLDTGERGEVNRHKIRGHGARKQIPVEYVTGQPPYKTVRYRIYVSHVDEGLMGKLEDALREQRIAYPISLGPAYCLASLQYVEKMRLKTEKAEPDKTYLVVTVVPRKYAELDINVISRQQSMNQSLKIVLEETLPPDLGHYRTPIPNTSYSYYFEEGGKPIPVKLRDIEVFRLGNHYGLFM